MKKNKHGARKAFWWIVFILFFSVIIFDGIVYFAMHIFTEPMTTLAKVNPELPEASAVTKLFFTIQKELLLFGGVGSFLFFLIMLFLLWLPIRKKFGTSVSSKPVAPTKAQDPETSSKKRDQDQRLLLYLFTVLQREGRLMDFFAEDLTPFEDSQIGAAVRSIHENCKKIVTKTLAPKPVIDEAEGASVSVPPGFDPSAIKLVGNVSGDPPFSGILRHRGWQANKAEVPTLSSTQNASIISPAEVEIS